MDTPRAQWHLELIAQLHEQLELERIARAHAEEQAELGLNLLYRRQVELGIVGAISRAANESATIESGLTAALRALCEFGDWEIGHALLRAGEKAPLRSTQVWHCAERERFSGFTRATESLEALSPLEPAGQALARGQPVLCHWPLEADRSPRALAAAACEIISGYAFLVPAGRQGLAIIELFSTRLHEERELLCELAPQLATQLGRMLERHWAEEHLLRSRADLEAKVRERTETLASTIVELNKQMNEQRRTQHALQLHDRALAAAANGIVLVDALDPTLPIVYCNPAFETLLGVPASEILGRGYRLLRPPQPRDEIDLVANELARITRSGTRGQLSFEMQRKDGTWFWMHLTIAPVRDDHGLLTHFVGIIEDITEQKRAEEVLQRAKETTEAANAELSHAARLKDEFLAAMSHELRTPLNAVIGLTQALGEEVYGSLNDDQRQALRTIDESGRHLLDLINDILDVSKIESGKLILHAEETSPEAIAQASLRFIKELAQKKRLQVSSQVPDDVPIIVADHRRVKQMVVNLLTNAVKFTPPGGKIGLDVVVEPATRRLSFVVWDTGIGISAADQTRLFKPFVQIDSRLSRRYGGTGLGLALVRGMAELHGGSIAVESEPGRGSRFTLTLPFELPATVTNAGAPPRDTPAPATLSATPFPPPEASAARRRRVLLAEDNPQNQQTFRDYLSVCGFEVVLAPDGIEAVRLTAEERPDVVLMDVQMPRMDGLEATRRIRANPEVARTPIIALTALAMVGDDVRCFEAGVDKYLSKPVNLRVLATTIEELLAQRSNPRNPAAN